VIKVSTNWPDYYPVMQYAKDAQLRHDMWMNMMGLGFPKNTQVFVDVLKVRSEFAKLLGYASWADYATEEMMIKSPANSGEFIDKLADLARPIAERDKQELLEFKKTLVPDATAIDPWEKHYIKRLAKAAKYNYSQEEVRRYFEIDKVRQGILETSSRLYGIEFKPVEGEKFWHESVQVFDVFENGERIGRIHLDLFPRENKFKSFAMFPMVGGVDGIRISQGAIVGNFPDPSKSQGPALVDHYDVVTFFHEFGHLMHHILSGKQRYMRFSGTATEWDFVEVPSQLYEEWAWDHDVLKTFATDSEGKAIPEELVAKVQASDNFAKGLQVQQQMYYAALSRGLYVTDPEGIDIEKFNKEVCAKYSPWPYVEGTHFIEGFSHLIGYSSNYYTYMWSLVIAKDMVSPFKAKGMMDLETSTAYRKAVLGAGGSNDAAELVKVFLGREFQFEAFKSWLEKK